jgi:hypothetical protein
MTIKQHIKASMLLMTLIAMINPAYASPMSGNNDVCGGIRDAWLKTWSVNHAQYQSNNLKSSDNFQKNMEKNNTRQEKKIEIRGRTKNYGQQ